MELCEALRQDSFQAAPCELSSPEAIAWVAISEGDREHRTVELYLMYEQGSNARRAHALMRSHSTSRA